MVKDLSYIIFFVNDVRKSLEFYRDKLGLPVKAQHGLDWIEFYTEGTTLALHSAEEGEFKLHHRFGLVSTVGDVDKVYEELKAKGVSFTRPPEDQAFGRRTSYCTESGWQRDRDRPAA